MKAMILAAGEGVRLRPYTLQLPKPAIPFLGVPLIDYGLNLLGELGPLDLVINHHHLSDEITKLAQRPQMKNRKVDLSDERSVLLGSGGGIHHAKAFLQNEENFVVVNGDEVILPHQTGQIKNAYENHVQSGRLATLLVMDHPEVGKKFGGAWCDDSGEVQAFSKTPVGTLKGLHYIGVIFLSKRIFSYFKNQIQEENLLYETLTLAMAKGEQVQAFRLQTEWFETGNAADFLVAASTCIDAIQNDVLPWAKNLKQFLQTQTRQASLIEKQDLLLESRLNHIWQSF